jgi:hypothetical protein
MIMNIPVRCAIILACAGFLTGCKTAFHNQTPSSIPRNDSGLYTFVVEVDVPRANLIRGSERAIIVINNETFAMQRVDAAKPRFTFDYRIPPGTSEARYYYEVTYDYNNSGIRGSRTIYSTHYAGGIYQARLTALYPIQLIPARGPVGATVALVGTGFTPQDRIIVNTIEADARVTSPNSIEFTVPPLAAGRNYEVSLRTGTGDVAVGSFRVDAATLRVHPASLALAAGGADMLVFEITHPAPAGGIYIDVRTDIPASVIMPEIIIPAGARSVSVRIEGGEPGSGRLEAEIPGFNKVVVPVQVR